MKMSNEFVCCERCFETLAKRSTKAAKIWIDLCQSYMNIPGLFSVEGQTEQVRILETLGFVITTDCSDDVYSNYIILKVNGHHKDAYGENYFCIKDGRHA